MQLLANYAARFAEAVQRAATTLPAATEVESGSGAVLSVVESGPQQIVIRMYGRNRRYPVGQLPLGLAVVLLVSTCRGAVLRPWCSKLPISSSTLRRISRALPKQGTGCRMRPIRFPTPTGFVLAAEKVGR